MTNTFLPVIIEQLISKVTDSKTHPETRQHYATTLQKIVDESQKALKKYDQDKMMKVKSR
jgi:hypothetical protein